MQNETATLIVSTNERISIMSDTIQKLSDESNEQFGFEPAIDLGRQIATETVTLLKRIESVKEDQYFQIAKPLSDLNDHLGRTTKTLKGALPSIERGLHRPEFPNERDTFIAAMQSQYSNFHNWVAPIDERIRLRDLEAMVNNGNPRGAKELQKELQRVRQLANDELGEIEKIRKNLNSQATQTMVSEGESIFLALCKGHQLYQWGWFFVLVVSALGLGFALWYVISFSDNVSTSADAAVSIFRRLLILSGPLILVRIAMDKYNLERNLFIVYKHRETVMKQYLTFENAIADADSEAKNILRLEIVKYVFDDPQSGYIGGKGSQSELNISPVFAMAERMVKQQSH